MGDMEQLLGRPMRDTALSFFLHTPIVRDKDHRSLAGAEVYCYAECVCSEIEKIIFQRCNRSMTMYRSPCLRGAIDAPWRLLLLAGVTFLVACGGSSSNRGAPDAAVPPPECQDEACAEDLLVTVQPDASSLVFSDNGRLFVGTRTRVYEVFHDGEEFTNKAVIEPTCSFTGLASQGDYLYAVCNDGRVFGALLNESPQLAEIHVLKTSCRAGGMTMDADGNLYVADSIDVVLTTSECALSSDLMQLMQPDLPPEEQISDPKVLRVNIDPSNPLTVLSEDAEPWLDHSSMDELFSRIAELWSGSLEDLQLQVAGLTIDSNFAYATIGGVFYRVEILPGGVASTAQPGFGRSGAVLGGLAVIDVGFLVTDILQGTFMLLSQSAELLDESESRLNNPGAIAEGVSPIFEPNEIMVVELPPETGAGDGELPVRLDN